MDSSALQGYCDYNATAPLHPDVAQAMAQQWASVGNPSSVHRFGRAAKKALDQARAQVAALVNTRPSEIVFTSGGTEANNLAFWGVKAEALLVSAIEHDSVLNAARAVAQARGLPLMSIPVLPDGRVDIAALEELLKSAPRPALVSVMLANNETGVLQPVAAVRDLARAYGALFHCDAVQGAGKIPLDVNDIGADMLTLSAHKIGGPLGIGALVIRDTLPLQPMLWGGRQETNRRAGTENLPAIVGFGAAAALARAHQAAWAERMADLRDRFEAGVRKIAGNRAVIHGADAPRLPNTSCVGMPGALAETQVIAMDLAGVAVSAGSACSSGKVHSSHVLRAMGQDDQAAREAVRISFGWASAEGDLEKLLAAWGAQFHRAQARAAQ